LASRHQKGRRAILHAPRRSLIIGLIFIVVGDLLNIITLGESLQLSSIHTIVICPLSIRSVGGLIRNRRELSRWVLDKLNLAEEGLSIVNNGLPLFISSIVFLVDGNIHAQESVLPPRELLLVARRMGGGSLVHGRTRAIHLKIIIIFRNMLLSFSFGFFLLLSGLDHIHTLDPVLRVAFGEIHVVDLLKNE
jgi:hypothetical protein